jgi:competence protein ComGC
MKTKTINEACPKQSAHGLTLTEVIITIVMIFILAILILPAVTPRPVRAKRITCMSNLKQVGLAMRMWSNEHEEKFPWQVSGASNGTLEFAESPAVFRHFLALSNELTSPKVLVCNSDKNASRESDWTKLNNAHLSYFVGLDSNHALPQTILSGDRNIIGGMLASNGIVRFSFTNEAGWNQDMHKGAGNIGLGDGSVMQVTANSLGKQIQAALLSTNVDALRFSIPKPN